MIGRRSCVVSVDIESGRMLAERRYEGCVTTSLNFTGLLSHLGFETDIRIGIGNYEVGSNRSVDA